MEGASDKVSPLGALSASKARIVAVLLAVTMLGAIAGAAAYKLVAERGQAKFVVIDMRQIVVAATRQIIADKGLSPDQISTVSRSLGANLKKVVESYRRKGYVVLNANMMVSYPESLDITKKAAEELGVTLDDGSEKTAAAADGK